MKKFDKALKEALANSSIDQNQLKEEEIDIIKKASIMATNEDKSFLSSLYELTKEKQNEESKHKSR